MGLLISAISTAITTGLALFWQLLQKFIVLAAQKLMEVFADAFAESANVFVTKSIEGVKQLAANYLRRGNKYFEKVVAKNVDESTLPSDIRQKVNNNYGEEIDITSRFAKELRLV